jgi:WD40 repeat protein
MKRIVLCVVLMLFVVACGVSAPVFTPTAPAAQQVESTAIPTDTPTPAYTPTPAASPTLAPTPTPEPTKPPEPISKSNVEKLALASSHGGGRVEKVAWAPDGSRFLVLTSAYLRIFETSTAKQTLEIYTNSHQMDAAFSPDGDKVVGTSRGGSITVWDAKTGKLMAQPVQQHVNILGSGLSASGKLAGAINHKKEIEFYNPVDGQPVGGHNGLAMPYEVTDMVISPDGETFVVAGFSSGSAQQIQLWEVKTGKFLRGLTGVGQSLITDVVYSPSGKLVGGISRLQITSGMWNAKLFVWNASDGSLVKSIEALGEVTKIGFTADDKEVVAGSWGGLVVRYNIETGGKGGLPIEGNKSLISSLVMSPDGKTGLSVGMGGDGAIFDLSTGKSVKTFDVNVSLAFTKNYKVLGIGYIVKDDVLMGMAISKDGKLVAQPSPDLRAVVSYKLDGSSTKPQVYGSGKNQYSIVAFSNDNKLLAAIKDYDNIVIWEVETTYHKIEIPINYRFEMTQLTFSPDNSMIAALSNGNLTVWQVADGKKVATLGGSYGFNWSADSKTIYSDNVDFGVYAWDVAKGRSISALAVDYVHDIDLSPDGKVLAVSGTDIHQDVKANNHIITFMDVAKNKALPGEIKDLPASVTTLRFSPSGQYLAGGDVYGNLFVWDVNARVLLKQINEVGLAPLTIEFLPDETGLVVGGSDGTIQLFKIDPPSSAPGQTGAVIKNGA